MSEHDMSGQARKGLIDSVKGKAKEFAGAITGNDSLTAEGQLEQAQARDRKEANSVQAVAEAETQQARTEATHAREVGARERADVYEKANAAERTVSDNQAAQKRSAEQSAQRTAEQAKTRAEFEVQHDLQRAKNIERDEIEAATYQAVDAAAEHQKSVQAADRERAEADRIRRQADSMTKQADLP